TDLGHHVVTGRFAPFLPGGRGVPAARPTMNGGPTGCGSCSSTTTGCDPLARNQLVWVRAAGARGGPGASDNLVSGKGQFLPSLCWSDSVTPGQPTDHRSPEAGSDGGHREIGPESRLAEVDTVRQRTHGRIAVLLNGRNRFDTPAQNGTGWRGQREPSPLPCTLATIPANSGDRRSPPNGDQERDNPGAALRGDPRANAPYQLILAGNRPRG